MLQSSLAGQNCVPSAYKISREKLMNQEE